MATELFLKSYIAFKAGLTEKQAKHLGHNLRQSFEQFVKISGDNKWEKLKSRLDVFPEVHERYNEQTQPLIKIWDGFAFAQSIGTVLVRELSGRNTLAQVILSKPTYK